MGERCSGGLVAGGLSNALRTASAVRKLDSQLREINDTYKQMVANAGPLREWKHFKTAGDRVAFVRARPADDLMAQVAYFDTSYSPGAAPTFKTVAKTVSYKSVSSESVEQVAQRQSTQKLVTKQYSFELEQSIAHNSGEHRAGEPDRAAALPELHHQPVQLTIGSSATPTSRRLGGGFHRTRSIPSTSHS
jgi:hypothetical protein